MLDLSYNEIIDLAPGTFLSQLNLLLVDLSNNRILRTPYGAFGKRVATVLLRGDLSSYIMTLFLFLKIIHWYVPKEFTCFNKAMAFLFQIAMMLFVENLKTMKLLPIQMFL